MEELTTDFWKDLFIKEGKRIVYPNHYRVLIEDEESIYFFEKGNLDLFATEILEIPPYLKKLAETSEPFTTEKVEGRQVFFKEISKPCLVFSFPCLTNQPIHMIGRSNDETIIYKMKISAFEENIKNNEEAIKLFHKELSRWFSFFTPSFSIYRINYPSTVIPITGRVETPEVYSLVPVHKIDESGLVKPIWLRVLKGQFYVIGLNYLVLSAQEIFFYPLVAETWLRSARGSELETVNWEELEIDEKMWNGIKRFHKDAIHIFAEIESEKNKKQKEKIKQTRILDKKNIEGSLSELENVLNEDYVLKNRGKSLLYNVCQVVGDEQDLVFVEPKENDRKLSLMDQVGQLCLDSKIQYRPVRLREDWWKNNLGPLLGFYGEENTPIALIPQSQGPYKMIDLKNDRVLLVDEHVDERLNVSACMFYRTLPNRANLTGREVIAFGMKFKMKELYTAFFFGAISSLLALFFPFAVNIIFNTIIPFSENTLLAQLTIGLVLVSIAVALFKYLREYVFLRFQGLLSHDLQTSVWQRIFSLPSKFFRRFEVGDLIQRASAIETIRQKVSGPNLRVIVNAFFALLYLIPMFYYSPLLGLVGLLIGCVGIALSFWAVFKTLKYYDAIFSRQGEAGALVLQFLFGISKVRITGSENTCFLLWEKIFYKIKKIQWPLEKINNWAYIGNFAVANISMLILYAVGFYMVQKQAGYELTPSHFIAYMAAFIPFSYAINALCISLMDISVTLGAWKRSLPIFEQAPEVDESKVKPGELTGQLRVDHAFFRYDEDGPLILKDISIKADAGEFVAIVGGSGSGKSTLIRLLIGFESPNSGAVFYDNKDLSTLDIRDVRRQLGSVLQISTLLSGSIRQNISAGAFYTDEEIAEAFKVAQFEEFFKTLPMGLETVVANDGETFSGGQKQRLMIARALIKKPKILIFDEATSALDNKIQDVLTKNLDKLNITRIIIAHRLSTIKNADRIYVFDKGTIIEEGTFDELAQKGGHFQNLLEKQQFG